MERNAKITIQQVCKFLKSVLQLEQKIYEDNIHYNEEI